MRSERKPRSYYRSGSPAPQSENASFSIQHSAFSTGATAPRVPHSAFSIGATAPRIQHSALGPQPPAFSIQHSALIDAPTICDIHHHIVWGIDSDGPQTPEDSINMLRAAAADGITCVIATPHVMPGIRPFDREKYLRHLDILRGWCRDQGLPLRLYPGAEIFYTPMTVQYLNEGAYPP